MADQKQKVGLKDAPPPLTAPLLPRFVAPKSLVDSSLRKNWLLWAIAFPLLNGLVVWLVLSSFSNGASNGGSCTDWGTARALQKLNRSMVILISSDGFRWDYQFKGPTPNIDRLRLHGTEAESGMIPVYPSLTFPNHYSIVTGLYPAWHGVIGNSFSYPNSTEKFKLNDTNPKWWLGEPIWETAAKNNLPAAAIFWPGSEVKKGRWTCPECFCPRFKDYISFEDRVDRVLNYTELPEDRRPSLIALYFDEPDKAGHAAGPGSRNVTDQVARIDSMIGRLMDGLEKRGILDDVTIIMVGDHGMMGSCPDKAIYLEDLAPWITIRKEWIDSFTPVLSIRPSPKVDVAEVFKNITKGLRSGKVKNAEFVKMYLKEDLPERLHFSGSERIQPIIGMVEEGYAVMQNNKSRKARPGEHGYDNAYLSMRTIFFARGPQFARGRKMPSFENVQLYNVMTSILGIEGAPNNGTPSFAKNILLPKPKEHRHQSHSK